MILSLPPCSLKYAAFTRSDLPRSLEWHFGALVLHPPRLVVPARQLAGRRCLHGDADAEPHAQRFLEDGAESLALGLGERRRRIDPEQDVVEAVLPPEDDLELIDAGERTHELLDAPWIDDDAAHLLHVVEPGQHAALEGEQRAPARTAAIGELDDVARAIANQRHRAAIEAREDELAAAPGGDGRALLVEDLRIAVVLVYVHEPRARVALEAPRGDLGQPRQVEGAGAEGGLDLRARGRDGGAGLAGMPREADLRLLREVDAFLRGVLGQEERVRRGAAEHRDRVGHQRIAPLIR